MFFAAVYAIVQDYNYLVVAECVRKNTFYLFDNEVVLVVDRSDDAEFWRFVVVFFVQG